MKRCLIQTVESTIYIYPIGKIDLKKNTTMDYWYLALIMRYLFDLIASSGRLGGNAFNKPHLNRHSLTFCRSEEIWGFLGRGGGVDLGGP